MNWRGDNLALHVFGASHSEVIGMTLEGIPAGERIDLALLRRFLDRRAPGRTPWSTPRKEPDAPEFTGGLSGDQTDGSSITAPAQQGLQRPCPHAPARSCGLSRRRQIRLGLERRGRRRLLRQNDRPGLHRRRHLPAAAGTGGNICHLPDLGAGKNTRCGGTYIFNSGKSLSGGE